MPEHFDAYHKWLGIRPEEQPPNHYRLLGVALFESDPDVLAHAADQRMAHLRNFQSGRHRNICAEILNHMAAARICLLDPRKKQTYDVQLRESLTAQTPSPPPAPAPYPEGPPLAPALPRGGRARSVTDRQFARRKRDWVIRTVAMSASVLVCLSAALAWMYWNRHKPVVRPDRPQIPLAQLRPRDPPTAAPSGTSVPSPLGEQQNVPDRSASPTGGTIEEPSPTPGPTPSEPNNPESEPTSTMKSEPSSEPASEPSPEPASAPAPASEPSPDPPRERDPESAGQSHPVIVLTPPDDRAPIPSETDLAKALTAVREVYDADCKAARNREQKRELAARLLQKAEQTRNDLPGMMTLLKLVMEVAEQADDCPIQLRAIDVLAEMFQVDGLQMKAEALRKYAPKADSSIERDWVVQQAARMIDRALTANQFDTAVEFARLAGDSSGAAADAATEPVHERIAEIDAARQAYEEAQQAIAALTANESDEEASLVLGKYLCLVKGDWERGLPWLAKSNDPALKDLAARDQAGAMTSDAKVELADSWWDMSEQATGSTQKQMRERAAFRYRQALSGLTGLNRDRVIKRLADMAVEMRISLSTPKAINQFVLAPGPGKVWKTTRGALHIRGDMTYTIFNTYFKSISSVTIVGGIVLPDRHNFRISVGPVNAILNWEGADQNHFRYGEGVPRPKTSQPSALVPGKVHSIQIQQEGDNVTVSVDGKQHFSTSGVLEGTVTIYAGASEIMIRELTIVGEPDLSKIVTGPSHKNLH